MHHRDQLGRGTVAMLDRLIARHQHDTWPTPSLSDSRKAVYRDILNGFRTLHEAAEHIEYMPEDSVIFTARGDEIPFVLIKAIVEDIERNPWLSPFTGTPTQTASGPVVPEIDRYYPGRTIQWQAQIGRRVHRV